MKKLIPFIMAALLLLALIPVPVMAGTRTRSIPPTTITKTDALNSRVLLTRLSEIRAMNFSSLTRSEKRDLRQELRSMKSQFAAIGGGVYISVGAIIVILILLLLIF